MKQLSFILALCVLLCSAIQAQDRPQTFTHNGVTISVPKVSTSRVVDKAIAEAKFNWYHTILNQEKDSLDCAIRCYKPYSVQLFYINRMIVLADSASFYFKILYPNWPTTGCTCKPAGK